MITLAFLAVAHQYHFRDLKIIAQKTPHCIASDSSEVQYHAGMFPPQRTAYIKAYLLSFCSLTQFTKILTVCFKSQDTVVVTDTLRYLSCKNK